MSYTHTGVALFVLAGTLVLTAAVGPRAVELADAPEAPEQE